MKTISLLSTGLVKEAFFKNVSVLNKNSWKSIGFFLLLNCFVPLIFLFESAHLQAQIQFEQVLPSPPAPRNIAHFEAVSSGTSLFADVDGDGDEDLLHTGINFLDQPISYLYKNDGIGNFSRMIDVNFEGVGSSSSSSAAFADVDGDGDLDVLITGVNDQGFIAKLYGNDGNGNFTEVLGTPFDGVVNGSVAFADVDGDGDQDVMITGAGSSFGESANLYKNDGNGNFTKVIGTPFPGITFGTISFADIDGDDDPDLLISGYYNYNSNNRIAGFYVNDGDGNFTFSENLYDLPTATSIKFADFDSDGDQDVLLSSFGSFGPFTNLYLNDGIGNFYPVGGLDGVPLVSSFGDVAIADVDGDSDLDVLATGDASSSYPISNLYLNDGTGIFTLLENTPFPGIIGSSVSFGDIDGDNDPDVLIAGLALSGVISTLYVNDGSGVYAAATGSPFDGVSDGSIAFADMDGDGDQDVLIIGQNSQYEFIAKLYNNDGSGGYSLVEGTPFEGGLFSSLVFKDVDGDNDQDVIITGMGDNGDFTTKLYYNDGTGIFDEPIQLPYGNGLYISATAFADVDGDGDLDGLISGVGELPELATKLYLNNGNGNFTEATGTDFFNATQGSLVFGDVDGDGDQDLIIAGFESTGLQIFTKLYTNDGTGNFTEVNGTPFSGVSGSIEFADADGDGDQDVLIAGIDNDFLHTTKLYSNDGNGNFIEVIGTPFDLVQFGSTVFSDVDGDEDLDLLITGVTSNSQAITKLYSNNGGMSFTEVEGLPFIGVYESSVAFADVDGDGDQDVCITGLLTANLYLNTTSESCQIYASCAPFTITLSPYGTATLQPENINNGSTVTCGTPILTLSQTEFDSSHIGENIVSLTVQDENGNSDSCQAIVTVIVPDPCRYFLSNHSTQGGSDVYELTINDNTNTASLNHLLSVPQRVTLSYNHMANLLYLGRENNSTFQTYNPDGGSIGLPIGVNVGLSGFAGATYGPDGLLYAASQTSGAVYRFNPANFTGSLYSAAQVNGGDIDFTADGELILVSRSPARAFVVNQNAPNTNIGPVPAGVSGLARRGDGTFLLSVQGYDKLIAGSTTEGDLGVRFDLKLNGAPFTPANGDLASGCTVPAAAMVALTETNLPENALEVRAMLASQPNPTEGLSTVIFAADYSTRASLEVFDMSGRAVATLFNADIEAGLEYRAEFNGAALPTGVYIYRLTTDTEVVIEKFMIAR